MTLEVVVVHMVSEVNRKWHKMGIFRRSSHNAVDVRTLNILVGCGHLSFGSGVTTRQEIHTRVHEYTIKYEKWNRSYVYTSYV